MEHTTNDNLIGATLAPSKTPVAPGERLIIEHSLLRFYSWVGFWAILDRFHSVTYSGFSLSLSDAVESKKGRGRCSRDWAVWRPKARTKTLHGTHAGSC